MVNKRTKKTFIDILIIVFLFFAFFIIANLIEFELFVKIFLCLILSYIGFIKINIDMIKDEIDDIFKKIVSKDKNESEI